MNGNGKVSASYENDTEKVFTSYDIQSCLYDERRVALFQEAIAKVVRPGHVVVDGGSGTGLLGMLAAKAGAARVYCLELNKEYIDVINENARRNGLAHKIIAMQGDAATIELPEQVDVIISEVISAGFFYEPQLQIIGNLRRFLKPGGALIPHAMENNVELISAQEQLYGLTFNYDTRFRSLDDAALTAKATYLSTDFDTVGADGPFDVAETVRIKVESSGRANAIRVGYRIQFTEGGEWAEKPTEFLLNPQIIFLRQAFDVEKDEHYDISLVYRTSTSPLNSMVSVTRAEMRAGAERASHALALVGLRRD